MLLEIITKIMAVSIDYHIDVLDIHALLPVLACLKNMCRRACGFLEMFTKNVHSCQHWQSRWCFGYYVAFLLAIRICIWCYCHVHRMIVTFPSSSYNCFTYKCINWMFKFYNNMDWHIMNLGVRGQRTCYFEDR